MAFPKNHPTWNTRCDDETFMRLVATKGTMATMRQLGLRHHSIVSHRKKRLEQKHNVLIQSKGHVQELEQHPATKQLHIRDGVVLIGSDGHFWPGVHSTAFKAFVKFCQAMNPVAVVMNGDAYDGARVSRWPDGGWSSMGSKPTVLQELEATQEALSEIRKASPKARHIFPLGNHDARFEMRLIQQVPEYAEVHGTRLKDHIEEWEPCWAVLVNKEVVIKHRFKAGIHAPHNNTMWAGRTIITGHLHSLKVMPLSDYNGTRWGVDGGCLADPYGPQFYNYTELNPVNWRAGFVVLTFKDGKLLWPETVWADSRDTIQWRGEVIRI